MTGLSTSPGLRQNAAMSAARGTPAHSLSVQTPATLAVTQVAGPSTLSQGQSFLVTVTFTNSGQATANLTGVSPVIRSSGGADLSSQYTFTAQTTFPIALTGGGTTSVTYQVTAGPSASTGGLELDATAAGTEPASP